MSYPCDDCPCLGPECPTNECTAFDEWYWLEVRGDDE